MPANNKLISWVFFVFGRGAGVGFAKKLMPVVYALFALAKSVVIFVITLALFTLARYCT